MKLLPVLSVATLFFIGSSGIAIGEEVSLGKREYTSKCASCHGADGKGNGPFAEYLKQGVPDLTKLRANNDGVFPVDRVFKIIEGSTEIKGHGTTEMPIWGDVYRAESVAKHRAFFGDFYAPEKIQARILALIEYLNTLQRY